MHSILFVKFKYKIKTTRCFYWHCQNSLLLFYYLLAILATTLPFAVAWITNTNNIIENITNIHLINNITNATTNATFLIENKTDDDNNNNNNNKKESLNENNVKTYHTIATTFNENTDFMNNETVFATEIPSVGTNSNIVNPKNFKKHLELEPYQTDKQHYHQDQQYHLENINENRNENKNENEEKEKDYEFLANKENLRSILIKNGTVNQGAESIISIGPFQKQSDGNQQNNYDNDNQTNLNNNRPDLQNRPKLLNLTKILINYENNNNNNNNYKNNNNNKNNNNDNKNSNKIDTDIDLENLDDYESESEIEDKLNGTEFKYENNYGNDNDYDNDNETVEIEYDNFKSRPIILNDIVSNDTYNNLNNHEQYSKNNEQYYSYDPNANNNIFGNKINQKNLTSSATVIHSNSNNTNKNNVNSNLLSFMKESIRTQVTLPSTIEGTSATTKLIPSEVLSPYPLLSSSSMTLLSSTLPPLPPTETTYFLNNLTTSIKSNEKVKSNIKLNDINSKFSTVKQQENHLTEDRYKLNENQYQFNNHDNPMEILLNNSFQQISIPSTTATTIVIETTQSITNTTIKKHLNIDLQLNNQTKVKKLLKNNGNTTNSLTLPAPLPSSTSTLASSLLSSSTSSLSSLNSFGGMWHHQQNLKVNQVFESERRMTSTEIQNNKGKIVLLGLFELTTKYGPRPDGLSELNAAMMAVEHINRKKILPGYTLEMVTNDTQCDPGVGLDRFFHAIYTKPSNRMLMLLGSACSEVTESIAKVVPYWNIVQVSFGSTSPALSDRQEFPYFYRTVAPDSSHNPARIAFIRRFGWDTVTTFSQNEEVHSLAVNDLVTELEAANISCAATITFAATDYKEQLLLLRDTDTRIIIGSFSQELAPKILCEAYRLRMFGADYAWILHESMGAPWWNTPKATANTYCSKAELQTAVENLIVVSSHNSIVGNNFSISGLNNDMFNKQLRKQFAKFEKSNGNGNTTNNGTKSGATIFNHNSAANETNIQNKQNPEQIAIQQQNQQNEQPHLNQTGFENKQSEIQEKPLHQQMNQKPLEQQLVENENHFSNEEGRPPIVRTKAIVSRYAPQTYDAVWAIALALAAAEQHWRKDAISSKLDRFDYTRADMAGEFRQQLAKLNFLGVSGPVSFSGPDRIGTTAFYQIQKGHLEPIALYYPAKNTLDFHCPRCKEVKWHSGQVPIAKRIFKLRVATIAPMAFYTIATLSSLGIAIAIAFLAFNLHFRKLKAIKLSSPKLSNITAVGCIFVYTAVILLGLDYSTLPSAEDSFATVCTARVYLLSAGFSLAFGSMFAKTYRVHRIFTRTGSVFKDKMLQDIQLILLVCGLLLVDGLVVTLWVVTDPMERHLHNLTLEISSIDRSVVYQPQVEVCRSQHTQTWLGALYAYKGLLLIVGVYMAWETRHVKIPALNDSQYIGVSVYSVVITSGIVVVLANLISERVTLAFITITALILTSTTATLCLLFIPKLHDIWARNDVIDPVIHSMGLKMEYNTRRFVIDDRRELQYRVEVQNRVYKKEINALDTEIRKLERMLEAGTASTATSSSTSLMAGQMKPELTVTSDTSIHLHLPPSKSRTPSISGILPNLLLSVLPPVIPRASWPSAEYMQIPMRRSVAFASQPQLEDSCLPAQDLYNLRLAHQHATETKTGIINRIRGIFSRTTSSNKGSSASLSDQKGLKAAFKTHMGLFTRLLPSQTASCNAIFKSDTAAVADPENAANQNLKPLNRSSFAKSGTHLDVLTKDPSFLPIPTISAEIHNENMPNDNEETCSSIGRYIRPYETKVNFQLPVNRRPSIAQFQPTLRERVKGSPRFPHRILPPTCSLSALEETDDRPSSSPVSRVCLFQASGTGNWKSMEVTGMSTMSFTDSKEDFQSKKQLESQIEDSHV